MEHRWHGHHRMHPRVMKEETAKRPLPPAALYGLQNLQRLDNDLSVSERYRVLGFSVDRGNLADLTAFVLADRAGFLCEGTSLQWVISAVLTVGKPLPGCSDERTFP